MIFNLRELILDNTIIIIIVILAPFQFDTLSIQSLISPRILFGGVTARSPRFIGRTEDQERHFNLFVELRFGDLHKLDIVFPSCGCDNILLGRTLISVWELNRKSINE